MRLEFNILLLHWKWEYPASISRQLGMQWNICAYVAFSFVVEIVKRFSGIAEGANEWQQPRNCRIDLSREFFILLDVRRLLFVFFSLLTLCANFLFQLRSNIVIYYIVFGVRIS